MRAIGIILAGGNNNRMRELSNKRAIAAMPIAVVGFRKKTGWSLCIYTYDHKREQSVVSGNSRCYLSESGIP